MPALATADSRNLGQFCWFIRAMISTSCKCIDNDMEDTVLCLQYPIFDPLQKKQNASVTHACMLFSWSPLFVGGDAAVIKSIEKDVKKEVDAAVEAAKQGPLPPLEWAWKNV